MHRFLLLAAGLVGVLALGGCASGLRPGPRFPDALRQEATLDVQVVRDSTVIRFANTSARAVGPSRMWLNRRYSREIPPLGIGESMELALGEFVDEFGGRFRAGGFFAAEAPERLVQAQLEPLEPGGERALIGLVVVSE